MDKERTMERKHRPIRTASTIAKLLTADGLTDYLANRVIEYNNRCLWTERQKRRYKYLKTAMSEFMKDKAAGDKAVLGKFISLQMKAAFDTGLRVGLAAYAVKTDKVVAPVEPDEPQQETGSK